jgi:8-oxo-dGTP diphosphatase
MARAPVLAAGGIVLRQEKTPLVAVVRLRKRNEWVLPKGKLDDGETARAAAEREVLEETGHEVSVHEFLGTLVYESGGRSKVVHYWRMEAGGDPVHELMHDVRAVDWLPLDAAVERLSRGYERAFLANVGPIALQAAASVEAARRSRTKQPPLEKRRSRRVAPQPSMPEPSIPEPSISEPVPAAPPVDAALPAPDEIVLATDDAVEAEASLQAAEDEVEMHAADTEPVATAISEASESDAAAPIQQARKNLVQKMRDWLRRAA